MTAKAAPGGLCSRMKVAIRIAIGGQLRHGEARNLAAGPIAALPQG